MEILGNSKENEIERERERLEEDQGGSSGDSRREQLSAIGPCQMSRLLAPLRELPSPEQRDQSANRSQNFLEHHDVRVVLPSVLSEHSHSDCSDRSLKRRFRTNFSEAQSALLEEAFQESHYPDQQTKRSMAASLFIPEDRITVWFQNRRAKWRRKEVREREKTQRSSATSAHSETVFHGDNHLHCPPPLLLPPPPPPLQNNLSPSLHFPPNMYMPFSPDSSVFFQSPLSFDIHGQSSCAQETTDCHQLYHSGGSSEGKY